MIQLMQSDLESPISILVILYIDISRAYAGQAIAEMIFILDLLLVFDLEPPTADSDLFRFSAMGSRWVLSLH